jgi:hypothetical protein
MARRFLFPMEPGFCHARSDWNDLGPDQSGASNPAVRACPKMADQGAMPTPRDHVAVMLHLLALYVSKAAILTISAFSVPVENRSPA